MRDKALDGRPLRSEWDKTRPPANDQKKDHAPEPKRKELEQLDRAWERQRDRLANKPAPAPSFGGPAGPPRNLVKEYDRLRGRWIAQRKAVERSDGEQTPGDKSPARDKKPEGLSIRAEFKRRRRRDDPDRGR